MGIRAVIGLLVLALAQVAAAGECRATLRPLLLQTDPDPLRLTEVRRLCEQEAAAGDADATYQLSFFYLGLGGGWDPATAIPLIQDAADRGVSEAQYWLAWQYDAGPLLVHDDAMAVAWYEKAAASRHRFALGRLAEAYEKGELGLAVNKQKSLDYRTQIRRCEEENAKAAASK